MEFFKADKSNYVKFLQDLHRHFQNIGKSWIISIASAAAEHTLRKGYDLKEIIKYIDFINVMTYDYYGAWKSQWGAYTGPVAPLYRATPKSMSGSLSVDWTMKYYACQIKDLKKLNMGIPFYGRFWNNVGGMVEGAKDDIWRKAEYGRDWFDGGSVNWADIRKQGWNYDEVQWNENTKTPYIYRSG